MQPPEHRESDTPVQPPPRRRGGAVGSALAGLALLAAKGKTLLALVLSAKWLLLAPKLLLSFGSIFLTLWFYALAFGWKFGIVFVLLILVHELGHWTTYRNFGVPVSLPAFIPFMGAFVTSPGGTPAQNVAAAIAGPLFGVAASAACWWYGGVSHDTFWYACAYLGFFLNLFNLLPVPMLDGGNVAGAIDARLWIAGIVLLLGWFLVFGFTTFGVLVLLIITFSSAPRIIALFRGRLDPRGSGLTTPQRLAAFGAYVGTIIIALAGAAATNVPIGR